MGMVAMVGWLVEMVAVGFVVGFVPRNVMVAATIKRIKSFVGCE